MTARRVVTLPPGVIGEAALQFAREAREKGAQLLELRSDLHPEAALDAPALAALLPLLVAERGVSIPQSWLSVARLVDRELPRTGSLVSLHAPGPLTPGDAEARWAQAQLPPDTLIKHVEPLGEVASAARLLETQSRLIARFGPERVTVLATGALALPFRAALSERNALDYLAATPRWRAASGQRLLADAVRATQNVRPGGRLGILGTAIDGSRSPRIHAQPFDRVELPEDAPVEALVDALRPHYRGFAVTSPFKLRLARHLGSKLEAINTLVRTASGWETFNTDVDGARAVLERLGARVTLLGDGGASAALRLAAQGLGISALTVKREEAGHTLRTPCVWTWPPRVAVPEGLSFAPGTRVAIIAYGAAAHAIAAAITACGGTPLRLGARWFIAQARAQRSHWENAV